LGGNLVGQCIELRRNAGKARALLFKVQTLCLRGEFDEHVTYVHRLTNGGREKAITARHSKSLRHA
jgi:hypothetical protein